MSPILFTYAGTFSLTMASMFCRDAMSGNDICALEAFIFATNYAVQWFWNGESASSCFSESSRVTFLHVISAVFFITAYRLSPLHPLARFPGPLVNRITSIKVAYMAYSGHRHLMIQELHKRYGTIVRTGPNSLSINSQSAINPLYASATAMNKSASYKVGKLPGLGLFWMRNRKEHNERRRRWAAGFTPQNIEKYMIVLEKRTFQLLNCIEKRADADGVVNILQCIRHWSYDTMGDITFGGSSRLELMEDGDPDELVKSGQLATGVLEILGEVPSLFDVLWYFPVTNAIRRLDYNVARMLKDRLAAGTGGDQSDLASYLIDESDPSMPTLSPDDLQIDTLFAVQAGSDTTTSVLTLTLYHILSDRKVYYKLRKEIAENFEDLEEFFPSSILTSLPYLNAVIDEGIRLSTLFPGPTRVVPPGGVIIEGRYIPEKTIVSVPSHSQAVSEANFWPEPLSFKPERWLPGGLGPGSRCNKSAVLAFSYGPFGCLGKTVAMQELRVAVARLCQAYEFELAPDFDSNDFLSSITNIRTTMFSYPLTVVASRRVA